MSEKYKIRDQSRVYFLTLTVANWVDVFTRKSYKLSVVDSLKYCQINKGLTIFGYCLMTNHLHLIARAEGNSSLSDIIRDFKKFTSKHLILQIKVEDESRKKWMLDLFTDKNVNTSDKSRFIFWQEGYHAEEIISNSFFNEKLDYIHNNPVKELIVERPEDYYFSSARN